MSFLKPVLNGFTTFGSYISYGFCAVGSGIKNFTFSNPKPYKIEGPITYQRLFDLAEKINKLTESHGAPRLAKTRGDDVEVDEDTTWRQLKDKIGINQSPELISRYVFEFFEKAYENIPKIEDEDQEILQNTIRALDKQAKISENSIESKKNYSQANEIVHNLIFKDKIKVYLEMLKLAEEQTKNKKLPPVDFKNYCIITAKILGNSPWFAQWFHGFNKASQLESSQSGKDLLKLIDSEYREEDFLPDSAIFVQSSKNEGRSEDK